MFLAHPPALLSCRRPTADAQYLVNQLQIYYLADAKYEAVKTFNHDPAHFDYNAIIKDVQAANSSLA